MTCCAMDTYLFSPSSIVWLFPIGRPRPVTPTINTTISIATIGCELLHRFPFSAGDEGRYGPLRILRHNRVSDRLPRQRVPLIARSPKRAWFDGNTSGPLLSRSGPDR